MATTSTERMRKKKERDKYKDPESDIAINRAFARRIVKLLPVCPEADQLKRLIEGNENRIIMKEENSSWSRSYLS